MSTTMVDPDTNNQSRRFYDNVMLFVLGAIKAMGLDPIRAKRALGKCKEFPFTLELVRDRNLDTGVKDLIPGFVVLWWPGDEPIEGRGFKGGTRFAPVADLWLAKALALLMMIRCALLGLPFDGAKCAIQIDPDTLSNAERQRLGIAYAEKLIELGIGGPHGYVTASDMGTGEFDMDSICAGYRPTYGELAAACVTSKTDAIPGRRISTGYFAALEAVLTADDLGIPQDQRTASIQGGLGKVGYWTAFYLHKAGWRILAVSELVDDCEVAIFAEDGIDPEALFHYVGEHGRSTFATFRDTQEISRDEFLRLPVTALVLAAAELAVDEAEADIIGALSVDSPANGGITYQGSKRLHQRNIWHSSLRAGSGGVGVSWLEWALALGEFENYSIANPPSEELVLRLVEQRLYAARLAKLDLLRRYPDMTPGEADFAVGLIDIGERLDAHATRAIAAA